MVAIRGVDDSSTSDNFGAKATAMYVGVALQGRYSAVVLTCEEVVDTSGEDWTEVAVQTFCLLRRRERMEADRIEVERTRARLARQDTLLPEAEIEQEQGYDSWEEDSQDPEDVLKELEYRTTE